VEDALRSGELARVAGLSSDTLRHYERIGLLAKPPRTLGGYRDYPGNTLERVQLIRRALSVGFSLAELTTVLKIRDLGGVPCHQVRAIAQSKLLEVQENIRELVALRKQLEVILAKWDLKLTSVPEGKRARLLETLPDRSGPIVVPRRGSPMRVRKRRQN